MCKRGMWGGNHVRPSVTLLICVKKAEHAVKLFRRPVATARPLRLIAHTSLSNASVNLQSISNKLQCHLILNTCVNFILLPPPPKWGR